jgi:hypothetical protein
MAMRPTRKCYFVSGLPSESPKIPTTRIPTTRIPATLGAHNFVCRPPIEMRFKEKLALVKGFPIVCCTPPARKEIEAIPDF